MGAKAYLSKLQNKHASLDAEIRQELKNPLPDTLRISTLKKRKLHLKDQISSVRAS